MSVAKIDEQKSLTPKQIRRWWNDMGFTTCHADTSVFNWDLSDLDSFQRYYALDPNPKELYKVFNDFLNCEMEKELPHTPFPGFAGVSEPLTKRDVKLLHCIVGEYCPATEKILSGTYDRGWRCAVKKRPNTPVPGVDIKYRLQGVLLMHITSIMLDNYEKFEYALTKL